MSVLLLFLLLALSCSKEDESGQGQAEHGYVESGLAVIAGVGDVRILELSLVDYVRGRHREPVVLAYLDLVAVAVGSGPSCEYLSFRSLGLLGQLYYLAGLVSGYYDGTLFVRSCYCVQGCYEEVSRSFAVVEGSS